MYLMDYLFNRPLYRLKVKRDGLKIALGGISAKYNSLKANNNEILVVKLMTSYNQVETILKDVNKAILKLQ